MLLFIGRCIQCIIFVHDLINSLTYKRDVKIGGLYHCLLLSRLNEISVVFSLIIRSLYTSFVFTCISIRGFKRNIYNREVEYMGLYISCFFCTVDQSRSSSISLSFLQSD